MTDHRLFGQTDIDEADGGELSLCCICGKTFLDRRSLHLHVAIDHESTHIVLVNKRLFFQKLYFLIRLPV